MSTLSRHTITCVSVNRLKVCFCTQDESLKNPTGGGTGFIGSRLGELLMRSSYTVTNVSRMPAVNNTSWTDLECNGLPPMTDAVVNCSGQQVMDLSKKWTAG